MKTRMWMAVSALGAALVVGAIGATAQDVTVIRNVNIVPMDREAALEGMTVVVRDGKITAIGRADDIVAAKGWRVVEGHGRYLVPGLTNMHVHVNTSREPLLGMFLAHGVTTVRTMGAPSEEASRTLLQWREEIHSGKRLGPELVVSSRFISREAVPSYRQVTTPEEARDAVRESVAAGYDFVKVVKLDRDAFFALMDEARERNTPVAGHVPSILSTFLAGYPVEDMDFSRSLTLREILGSGMISLEHLDELFKFGMIRIPAEEELPEFVRKIRESGIAICPILIATVRLNAFMSSPDEFLTQSRLEDVRKYLGPESVETAKKSAEGVKKVDEPTRRLRKSDISFLFRVLKRLQEEGVTILPGTDSWLFTYPGLGLHDELELMVEAGLTPYEALRAATYNAAMVLGRLESSGTIDIGKRADLVLVNGNPLDDIRVLRAPAGVMVGGRWLDQSRLDRLHENAETPDGQATEKGDAKE